MVVLDTCAIIELVKPAPSFSKKALDLMESGSYILSVSFAEIACKTKIGKLEMNITPRELYHFFTEIQDVKIMDIGINEWFNSIDLDWENKDPADRIITSFAMENKLAIVTTDNKIKHFYKHVIW